MENKVGLVQAERVASIIGAFYAVYNYYGPGLLESVYSAALEAELISRRHKVNRELNIPVLYKEQQIGWQRADLAVDGCVLVELKATEAVNAFAERQILSYLSVTKFEVGLLLHFGLEPRFKKFVDLLDRRRRGPYARRA